MKNVFCIGGIILISFLLRIYGINWDNGYHLHPDERMITMVVNDIHFPNNSELSTIFTPESPLNPKFFPYGSFPIYLLKTVGGFLGIFNIKYTTYDYLNIIGRYISALFDTGIVFIIYLLGKKIFNKKVGLLSSVFYSLSVFPIQASHFFAVDVMLTFFVILTLYFIVILLINNNIKLIINIGLSFGFALATKISSILLVVPISLGILFFCLINKKKTVVKIISLFKYLFITLLLSFFTFILLEPYSVIDFATFSRQTLEQSRMTKDAFTFPYTLQYVNTIPYLYHLKNMTLWGMGIPLGVLSIIGSLYITFYVIKEFFKKKYLSEKSFFPILIILSFFWIYFFITGRFAIKFMRYFLPIYPLFILFGANLIFSLRNIVVKIICIILAVSWCLIYSISFLSIYSKPTTRLSASNWISNNIPEGAIIAREHWDDGLPLFGGEKYKFEELKLYEQDTDFKWQEINEQLKKTDYIIIASNRLYVPLQKLVNCSKLPQGRCYTKTSEYYQKLFGGKLGFKKAAEFLAYPEIPLIKLSIIDDYADESFTVYDHPKVIIFKKMNDYQ